MATKATLSVCGRDFSVLEFNITLMQQSDNQGRPASGVFLGDFYFILRAGSDVFFEWISEPTRMESGVLKTYKLAQDDTTFVEYSFVQGYVTTILENYYYDDGISNAFNSVSEIEDSSEDFQSWARAVGFQREDDNSNMGAHVLGNSIAKTREFQQRTGIPYVLMITMSCEKVTIRDIEHQNQWGRQA